MHELDQMTPNQRLNAFMTGQAMDRMLAMPVIVSMSGDVCGMTHREKRSSPENEAKCQIEAYKRFGNDLAVIEYGLHMVGVGLGERPMIRSFRHLQSQRIRLKVWMILTSWIRNV